MLVYRTTETRSRNCLPRFWTPGCQLGVKEEVGHLEGAWRVQGASLLTSRNNGCSVQGEFKDPCLNVVLRLHGVPLTRSQCEMSSSLVKVNCLHGPLCVYVGLDMCWPADTQNTHCLTNFPDRKSPQ